MTAIDAVGDRFDFGRVFSRSFEVITRNFVPFYALSLIAAVPGVVASASLLSFRTSLMAARVSNTFPTLNFTILVCAYVLSLVFGVMLQAALSYGTSTAIRREPVSLVRGLSIGASQFFPLLGMSIIIGLLVALGFVLLIIPGVMVLVALSVALPVRIIERKDVFDCLRRSGELTSGHRWAVFGVFAVTYLVLGIVTTTARAATTGALLASEGAQGWPGLFVSELTAGLTVMIMSTVLVSLYYELRGTKEGILPEQVASVFD